MQKMLKN